MYVVTLQIIIPRYLTSSHEEPLWLLSSIGCVPWSSQGSNCAGGDAGRCKISTRSNWCKFSGNHWVYIEPWSRAQRNVLFQCDKKLHQSGERQSDDKLSIQSGSCLTKERRWRLDLWQEMKCYCVRLEKTAAALSIRLYLPSLSLSLYLQSLTAALHLRRSQQH